MMRLGAYILAGAVALMSMQPVLGADDDHALGMIDEGEETYDALKSFVPPVLKSVPDKVSLEAWFPTPGNQGGQGSCVAWATAYAMKSYQEKAERKWQSNTKKTVFSPAYIYNQIKNGDCNQGSKISNAMKLLAEEGVATWADFPYSDKACSQEPPAGVKAKARPYRIKDWGRLKSLDVAVIKKFIAGGYPVVIGAYVHQNFMKLKGASVYGKLAGKKLGGHAMIIVGYDDERRAFRFMNSWGTKWGDKGFAWVGYNVIEEGKFLKYGYVAFDETASGPDKMDGQAPSSSSGSWQVIN